MQAIEDRGTEEMSPPLGAGISRKGIRENESRQNLKIGRKTIET